MLPETHAATTPPASGKPRTGDTAPAAGTPRIGYVLKMYPRFSETFVVSEIIAREARGADIEIFSLRPPVDPRFHDTLARVQAPVTYVPRARKAEELWQTLRGASPLLPRLPELLPELLREDACDAAQAVEVAVMAVERGLTHLHAHFASMATTVARLAALLAGITYSFTAHAKDLFHESVEHTDVARKIADAHHVVTVSDFNVRHLRTAYPFAVAGTPVHRIYNGLDLDAFAHLAPGARPASQVPTVVAVGRLVEKKGFDVLVDAVAALRAAGRDLRCRIVGAGLLEADLRAQIARLGLDDVVELTGPLPQDRVREEVRTADVLAAPCVVGSDGNADGLPTVLLEAMALGTPCISTDVTGITEAVRHEVTGLQVPQHDPAALAAAITRLLDDRPLRDRLAGAARELVEAEFDSVGQAGRLDAALAGDRGTVAPQRAGRQLVGAAR
ncbi:glycosyltransferase family 4 protein [Georgenia subflava]|uniref:Glycosyltransferase n=1 Tax=Georgenia subflava TaxID=1622177 RepID=A0A6N7EH97_9MICO|nr:glycosyltransferase family 4 protein [Georgenia subflava]MPV37420.1 glycosyltransferase [Georgenia subflava]